MDPYRILEVPPTASDAELRAAYRRAVQRTHPDHNPAPDAADAFEAVQEAWSQIRRRRADGPAGGEARPAAAAGPSGDADLEARLAAMEEELRAARAARDRAERAAREAAATAHAGAAADRPSDEDLGYIRTDDSLGKILSDARDELLGDLRDTPARERAADLLEEVTALLRGEKRRQE
jgi:curved DNA-binding protein CbpA